MKKIATLFLISAFVFTMNDNFVVNSSGNVGIGTSSPVYKLDVNGDFNDFFDAKVKVVLIFEKKATLLIIIALKQTFICKTSA